MLLALITDSPVHGPYVLTMVEEGAARGVLAEMADDQRAAGREAHVVEVDDLMDSLRLQRLEAARDAAGELGRRAEEDGYIRDMLAIARRYHRVN